MTCKSDLNSIKVENFILNLDQYEILYSFRNKKIECLGCGEQLIYIPKHNRVSTAYFRHKGSLDSSWCKNWQNNFSKKQTEQTFKIKNELENKHEKCRADIYIEEHNTIIEIQKSYINEYEILQREKQYKHLLQKKLIWVLYGDNASIYEVSENIFMIDLTNVNNIDKFIKLNIPYVYIDCDKVIYRVDLHLIKNDIIKVYGSLKREKFIKELKNGIESLVTNTEINKPTLTRKQRGAGCGKTYESINSIHEYIGHGKRNFIYLTKVHSAKSVINKEFAEQTQSSRDLEKNKIKPLLQYNFIKKHNEGDKQYHWKGKISNDDINIVIGTIDSFMYNLYTQKNSIPTTNQGYFEIITKDLLNIDKFNKHNFNTTINFKTLIIVDECQDLEEYYLKTLDHIGYTTGVDISIIGDILQSIYEINNTFTISPEKLATYYMNIKEDVPRDNICRRFENQTLMDIVNDVVKFSDFKFNSCPLQKITEIGAPTVPENKKYFEIIESVPYETEKISQYTQDIIKTHVKPLADKGYEPEDFMFILPYIKKNKLGHELSTCLQNFWQTQKGQEKILYQEFHKGEEGQPIDLDTSEKLTRIQSIHSSKGTGRKVVFLLGFCQKYLEYYRCKPGDIKYESLFHIAMTRSKEYLYISFPDHTNDDITKRFELTRYNILDLPKYTKSYKTSLFKINNSTDFKGIIETIKNQIQFNLVENKELVDWSNHLIKIPVLYSELVFHIIQREKTTGNKHAVRQIKRKLEEVSRLKIRNIDLSINYTKEVSKYFDNKSPTDDIDTILIFKKGYLQHHKELVDIIKRVQSKLSKYLPYWYCKDDFPDFCEVEYVVFIFLLQWCTCKQYAEIKLRDVYDIIEKIKVHDYIKCECKQYKDEKETKTNIQKFYKKITYIRELFGNTFSEDNIENNYGYNIDLYIPLRETNDKLYPDINIYHKFIFGYNDREIINFICKPSFNQINIFSVIEQVIFETYLLLCGDGSTKTDNKTGGKIQRCKDKKKITTYIITCDKHYKIELTFHDIEQYSTKIKDIMKSHILSENNIYLEKLEKYIDNKYKGDLSQFINDNKSKIPSFVYKSIVEDSDDLSVDSDHLFADMRKKFNNQLQEYLGLKNLRKILKPKLTIV